MKRLAPAAQPAIIGIAIGVLLPFVISICVFSSTLQSFLSPPPPDVHFWSGGPTPLPTVQPNPVEAAGGTVLRSAGGAVFLLGSALFAVLGALVARRRSDIMVAPWIGAAAGTLLFMAVALWLFLK